IEEHRETTIAIHTWEGEKQELLGNAGRHFPRTDYREPIDADLQRLPLADVWQGWYDRRPKKLNDADGLELLRAHWWLSLRREHWQKESPLMIVVRREFHGDTDMKGLSEDYLYLIGQVLSWLLR